MRRVQLDNFKGKKVALVMSGGVAKAAAWHIGVGLALEELGFTLKVINPKKVILRFQLMLEVQRVLSSACTLRVVLNQSISFNRT